MSIIEDGWNCATCLFAHHWQEERVRSRPFAVRGLFRVRHEDREERYTATGVQCLRYPEPTDTQDDHGCGEYRATQTTGGPSA